MTDFSDLVTATRAAVDPSTSPADLASIAQMQPGLRAQVAVHPNVYPELLQWMGFTGAQPAPAAPLAPVALTGYAPTGYVPTGYAPTGYAPSRQEASPARGARLPVAAWQMLVAGILAVLFMALGNVVSSGYDNANIPVPVVGSALAISAAVVALAGGILSCVASRNRRLDWLALNLMVIGFGLFQLFSVVGFRFSTGENTYISFRLSEIFWLVADSFGLLAVLVLAALVNLSMMAHVRRALAVTVMILSVFLIVSAVLAIHNGNVWDAIVRANGWGTNPAMTPGGWVMALLPLVMQVVMFAVLVLPLVTKAQASRGAVSVGSTRRTTAA